MNFQKYYSAIIAFLGTLGTFLLTLQSNEAITHAVPSNWTYGIGLAGSLLVGTVAHVKKLDPSVELVQMLEDIKKALDDHQPEEVVKSLPPQVQQAVVPVIEQVAPVIQDIQRDLPPVVESAKKSTQEVLDEVAKVIATYKKH